MVEYFSSYFREFIQFIVTESIFYINNCGSSIVMYDKAFFDNTMHMVFGVFIQ